MGLISFCTDSLSSACWLFEYIGTLTSIDVGVEMRVDIYV